MSDAAGQSVRPLRPGEATKRSALAQERSRSTRRRLVRAAMQLWAERGYEQGVETTTAAEIARMAGVTKATFYLHFARKEDILYEMAQETAAAFDVDADAELQRLQPATRVLDRLHASLAKRIEATDRAAVARAMSETRRRVLLVRADAANAAHAVHRFRDTYARVLRYAQARGELPERVDADDLARVLQALAMDAIEQWATGQVDALKAVLARQTALVLAGACATP